MKAVLAYGNGEIHYEEIPAPKLEAGTVKIKVMAAGICGSDLPRAFAQSAHYYPIVLGHEFSGVIEEIGTGVKNLQIGDHVVGIPLIPCMQCKDCLKGDYSLCKHYDFVGSRRQGAFAELVVLPESNVYKISPAIPFEVAALFEPATIALHAMFLNGHTAGGKVAILGLGTIGAFVAQWSHIFKADDISIIVHNNRHNKLASELHIDYIIDNAGEDFLKKVQETTNNAGYDYVYETAGSIITLKQCFAIAANKAHVCMIGTPKTDMSFTVKEWENLNRKEMQLTGSWMSYSKPFPGKEWEMVNKKFASGELKVTENMISQKFTMSEAKQAFNSIANKTANGKVLLVNE